MIESEEVIKIIDFIFNRFGYFKIFDPPKNTCLYVDRNVFIKQYNNILVYITMNNFSTIYYRELNWWVYFKDGSSQWGNIHLNPYCLEEMLSGLLRNLEKLNYEFR